jgi:general secretion pathway protein G
MSVRTNIQELKMFSIITPLRNKKFGSRTAKNTVRTSVLANEMGMTLIEIMIVIAIIAGLMAVLGAKVTNQLKVSKVQNTKLMIGELGKQLEAFNLACNTYPTTDQGLEGLVKNPGNCPNWGPEPYYKNVPKDGWGTPFIYESDGTKFMIKSLGADKKDGGEGFDHDLSSEDQ